MSPCSELSDFSLRNANMNKEELSDKCKASFAQTVKKRIYCTVHEYADIHYITKSIGSPPSNERFDYFSNFHEYKS